MPKTVKCPTCGTAVVWRENSKFRPFCSERCKLIDLGAWASERYSISGPPADETDKNPSDRSSSGQ
jgi:hypothetical protein